MKLYFLRHGIAEDQRPGHTDVERRLTDEGIEEMQAVGRGMKRLGLEFDAILTSPLVRARQTAALAADALGLEDLVREEPRLACGCGFGDLQDMLIAQPHRARILLVGHEPDFSTLVGAVIGGGSVRMKKATLACVNVQVLQPGGGELRSLLNAEHLVAISRMKT